MDLKSLITFDQNDTVLRMLEKKGQDYYLNLLKSRNQLVPVPGGGNAIISYPQSPVR